MIFLRKGKHVLTAAERARLEKMITDCRADSSGAKARFVVFSLLNEAMPFDDLHRLSMVQPLLKLRSVIVLGAEAIDKVRSPEVK